MHGGRRGVGTLRPPKTRRAPGSDDSGDGMADFNGAYRGGAGGAIDDQISIDDYPMVVEKC